MKNCRLYTINIITYIIICTIYILENIYIYRYDKAEDCLFILILCFLYIYYGRNRKNIKTIIVLLGTLTFVTLLSPLFRCIDLYVKWSFLKEHNNSIVFFNIIILDNLYFYKILFFVFPLQFTVVFNWWLLFYLYKNMRIQGDTEGELSEMQGHV